MSFCQSVNNFVFHNVRKKVYLQRISQHYFIQKKSTAEAYRIIVETYGDHALTETACRDRFRCFKNNDFDVEDKERFGTPKRFEGEELEVLLHEDLCQVQAELAELLGFDHTIVWNVRKH